MGAIVAGANALEPFSLAPSSPVQMGVNTQSDYNKLYVIQGIWGSGVSSFYLWSNIFLQPFTMNISYLENIPSSFTV